MSTNQQHTFRIHVVGCKVNQVEANMLSAQMVSHGWQLCEDGQMPDLVLVHTCTVTQRADRDSRRFITQAQKENPQALVAVSGCLAEMEKESLQAMPGVIAVIDQSERSHAADIIAKALRRASTELSSQVNNDGFFAQHDRVQNYDKSRAMIKIEDGCDGVCTFCRVRLARGKPVSRPEADILDELRQLVSEGFREVVITGVNIGCWEPGLAHLIPKILAVPGDFRIRISSIEPQHLNEELIQVLAKADKKLCPHLHLPLQSGDDEILQAMGRTYTADYFKKCIQTLRECRPDFVFSGDVIVGFPGESQAAFENTCELIKTCNMVRLHVFPYSERPGTQAALLDGKVLQREITERARILRELGQTIHKAYCENRVHQKTDVLLEQLKSEKCWVGTNETYDRVLIKHDGQRGELVSGCISEYDGQVLHVIEGGTC